MFIPGKYSEFLEQIGWNSFSSDKESPLEEEKTTFNKKEVRKARAEWLTKRKRILNPLEDALKKLEEDIEKTEAVHKKLTEKMLEVTSLHDSNNIQKTSKDLHGNQKKIDMLYTELESTMNKYEDEKIAFKRDYGDQV